MQVESKLNASWTGWVQILRGSFFVWITSLDVHSLVVSVSAWLLLSACVCSCCLKEDSLRYLLFCLRIRSLLLADWLVFGKNNFLIKHWNNIGCTGSNEMKEVYVPMTGWHQNKEMAVHAARTRVTIDVCGTRAVCAGVQRGYGHLII